MNEREVFPIVPIELEIIVRLVAKIRYFFTFVGEVREAVHSLFNYKYQTDEH